MNKGAQLWQDYEFLTRELDKFISLHNLEMFLELSRQRENLQKKIDDCAEAAHYQACPDGKQRLLEIARLNNQIQTKLLLFRNHSLQQQSVSDAYEGLGQGPSGNFFNRST